MPQSSIEIRTSPQNFFTRKSGNFAKPHIHVDDSRAVIGDQNPFGRILHYLGREAEFLLVSFAFANVASFWNDQHNLAVIVDDVARGFRAPRIALTVYQICRLA